MAKITKIHARQIIDSRGTPTVEVDLMLDDGTFGRSAVPSGASTGKHEALELRDGDMTNFFGKSVNKALYNINNIISKNLLDKNILSQSELDNILVDIDGTENKSNLGANSTLGVSLSFAHAMSASKKIPLFKYINELYGKSDLKLPSPMFNIMNGGKHANWSTDVQEFMVIVKEEDYSKQLKGGCEIFFNLEKLLKTKGLSTNVGNEGGFAPGFKNNEEAFDFISLAVEKAGWKLGENVFFALDIASSEFYISEENMYNLKTEGKKLSGEEWLEKIILWTRKYPLISIEDPFAEDDWEYWNKLNSKIGNKMQIVGDDLLVTNVNRIKKAINNNSCNALLVKLNQIGTLSETLDAMKTAQNAGWNNIVSHRSGETEDTTISHVAVGTSCGQIKTGAPSRGERTAKYNELLRISEILN